MKKIAVLIVLVLMVGCSLFETNPFVGTWRADISNLGFDPGDHCTITFGNDSFTEYGQIYSTSYSASGTYDYTDTVLMIKYKGYSTDYVSYVIYDDTMVWEGFLYFYRQ